MIRKQEEAQRDQRDLEQALANLFGENTLTLAQRLNDLQSAWTARNES